MSSRPPDDPFGDANPFKGMPIFGDLARLFQDQGPVSWDAARQLALSIAAGGEGEPNVDPVERLKLAELARVAELRVADATGFDTSVTGAGLHVNPVTRAQWAHRTLDDYKPLFEALADTLRPAEEPADPGDDEASAWMAPLMQMIGPMMLGMTAGSLVGHLARRTFGQYEPPMPRPASDEILLVPANIDEFAAEWSLPLDDVRLWVCLQEITYHALLRQPHVGAHLTGLVQRYTQGFQTHAGALADRFGEVSLDPEGQPDLQSLFADPEALLGAVQSEGQRHLLPEIETFVTTLVGYVDHVMDTVGGTLISSYGMLTEALRRRRAEATQADRFTEKLFGIQLTRDRYEAGNRFIAGVAERGGDEALRRLWESERTRPTPAELEAPGLWIARLELDLPD